MESVTKFEISPFSLLPGLLCSSHDLPIGHWGGLSREVINGMSSISRDISALENPQLPISVEKRRPGTQTGAGFPSHCSALLLSFSLIAFSLEGTERVLSPPPVNYGKEFAHVFLHTLDHKSWLSDETWESSGLLRYPWCTKRRLWQLRFVRSVFMCLFMCFKNWSTSVFMKILHTETR